MKGTACAVLDAARLDAMLRAFVAKITFPDDFFIGNHMINAENSDHYINAMNFSLISFSILMIFGVIFSALSNKKSTI